MPDITKTGIVYFFRAGDFIKIGLTENLFSRLQNIQVGNALQVTIAATVPGDHDTEKYYQCRFAPQHERGEWFRYEGQLRAYLKAEFPGRNKPVDGPVDNSIS